MTAALMLHLVTNFVSPRKENHKYDLIKKSKPNNRNFMIYQKQH